MQLNIRLMLLLSVVCAAVSAQKRRVSSLDIGDVAPRFKTIAWIKGDTVQKFVKNHTYVLEYWATWCKPCKAAMPHLSVLARQYRDRVTVLGINSFEEPHTTKQTVHAFVDSMGTKMDYAVAMQDKAMSAAWMNASAEQGIPKTFVVDDEGRIAWIGHPKDLGDVLDKIVNHTWDIRKAHAKRKVRQIFSSA